MMRENGMNRNEIGEEDRNPERLRPRTGHARERIAGRHRQRERDRDHGDSDESGIDEPLQELRVVEQHPEMV